MGVLIFLVLLGLVVMLSPFIIAGATYLLVYPPLLALVLFIFPPTRGWGVALFIIWLIYFGIKESIKDSQAKKLFVEAARNAGYERRAINKMIRTKKSNETWQDCINQLAAGTTASVSVPILGSTTSVSILTSSEAKEFIKDDIQRAVALKFVIKRGSWLNKYGLTNFARTEYKIDIPDSRAESLLSSLAYYPKRFIISDGEDEVGNQQYKLNCSVEDDVDNSVDGELTSLREKILKQQVQEYRDILSDHKAAIERYSSTFQSLALKAIKNVDKWGDYDEAKIDELKREMIYKVFKVINKENYKSEKSKAEWADTWFNNAMRNIGDKRLLNGTPYWMKHFYDIDLPKLLKPHSKKEIA